MLRSAGYELRRRPGGAAVDDGRLHFLHIGKNAGSQVIDLCEVISARAPVEIVAHGHHTFLRHIPSKSRYFFSVRDPVARFTSGFYSRKRKGRPRYESEWTPFEARAFETFEHANDLAEALFSGGALGHEAFGAIKSISHTAMDQVDWFYGSGTFLDVRPPVAIIRQDHLASDFEALKRRIGVDPSIAPVPQQDRSHANDYAGVPDLSDVARRNLKNWYAQDFEFVHQCEVWIAENQSP